MKAMNKIFRLIAIGTFYSLSVFGQSSIEENIARQTIGLSDNSDFGALHEILKDKRLVLLGEQSHYAGGTFEIKTNLTRHLIYDLGFDIIALESGFFFESIVMPEFAEEITGKKFNITDVGGGIWYSEECRPILNDINEGRIPVLGFDLYCGYAGIQCLEIALNQIDKVMFDGIDWRKMQIIYYSFSYPDIVRHISISEDDELYYFETLASIKNRLLKIKSEQTDNILLNYTLQTIKIFRENIADIRMRKGLPVEEPNYEEIIAANRLRDKVMADNIICYLDNNPDKKMVVWCASFHGARDIFQTEYPKYPSTYIRSPVMGEYLAEKYGDQMYSIAISSPSPTSDCLESVISHLYDFDFGFIDFTALRHDAEYFDIPFRTNTMGVKKGKFLQIFDAIYFLRHDRRNTPIKTENLQWAYPEIVKQLVRVQNPNVSQ